MYTEFLASLILQGLALFAFLAVSYFLAGVWYESTKKRR